MAPGVTLPIEERRKIVEEQEGITLNGELAQITGWHKDFAFVSYTASHQGWQFAWPTVKHIIEDKNGAFKA